MFRDSYATQWILNEIKNNQCNDDRYFKAYADTVHMSGNVLYNTNNQFLDKQTAKELETIIAEKKWKEYEQGTHRKGNSIFTKIKNRFAKKENKQTDKVTLDETEENENVA